MKRNYALLVIVAVIALAVSVLFQREQYHEGEYRELQKQLEALHSMNDSLAQSNVKLDKEIASYKKQADSLQKLITTNDRKKLKGLNTYRLKVLRLLIPLIMTSCLS